MNLKNTGPVPQNAQARLDALSAALLSESERFEPLLRTDDPLDAELRAAHLIAMYTSGSSAGLGTLLQAIMQVAGSHPRPPVAAMALAVTSLMPGRIVTGLATDLVRRGVLLPSWYRRLSLARPVQAWRYRDVFGDQEVVVISYRYGEARHAVIVETVTCPSPRVLTVQITTSTDRARAAIEASVDATGTARILQEISLIEAREAVSRAIRRPYRDARADDLVLLPVVRNRVGRLPEIDDEGTGTTSDEEYRPTMLWGRPVEDVPTRAERTAAVEEFLATAGPTTDVAPEVLRFWAEALVGYNALTRSAPTRVGPVWLDHALGDHVPTVFEVTPQQRAGLLPAVSAWVAWAAHRQALPAAATELVLQHVPALDAAFDQLYSYPDLPPLRCYLSDVAARTADGADLLQAHRQRVLAVPPPDRRPAGTEHLLAADPQQRRRIHAARIAQAGVPAGVDEQQWLTALVDVSDRLWDVEPTELTRAVTAQLDRLEVLDRHDYLIDLDNDDVPPDLLDRLAELILAHRDDDAFLDAVRSGAWAGLT